MMQALNRDSAKLLTPTNQRYLGLFGSDLVCRPSIQRSIKDAKLAVTRLLWRGIFQSGGGASCTKIIVISGRNPDLLRLPGIRSRKEFLIQSRQWPTKPFGGIQGKTDLSQHNPSMLLQQTQRLHSHVLLQDQDQD